MVSWVVVRSFNEAKTRWAAFETWTYAVTFDAPVDVRGAAHTDLVLGGVDTFASVYLNKELVAQLDSYHL